MLAKTKTTCYNVLCNCQLTGDMEKYPSLVEGTGLENREVGNGAGVRIPLSPPLNIAE